MHSLFSGIYPEHTFFSAYKGGQTEVNVIISALLLHVKGHSLFNCNTTLTLMVILPSQPMEILYNSSNKHLYFWDRQP